MVGSVPVGGDAPISVQTMTNSLTSDVSATLVQINAAADAGAEPEPEDSDSLALLHGARCIEFDDFDSDM